MTVTVRLTITFGDRAIGKASRERRLENVELNGVTIMKAAAILLLAYFARGAEGACNCPSEALVRYRLLRITFLNRLLLL